MAENIDVSYSTSPSESAALERVVPQRATTPDIPERLPETEYCEYSVLLFGGLQEAAGASSLQVKIAKNEDGVSVHELREICAREVPQLARWMPFVAVAVNREYSHKATRVFPADEIALLPPVAGGNQNAGGSENAGENQSTGGSESENFPRAAILNTPLDEAAMRAALERESAGGAGAILTFVGVVRDNARDNDGEKREVEALEYSAYSPMAQASLEKIIDEIDARFGAVCLIHHRVGRLEIGAASVVIAVASAHRDSAFEACRYAIEAIKREVPIWKKEFARDGSYWVGGPCEYSQNENAARDGAKAELTP